MNINNTNKAPGKGAVEKGDELKRDCVP